MRLGFRYTVLILLFTVGIARSQEKTGTEKKEPEARRVELPAEQNPTLPKIELPEFVITGIAQLSIPDVQKNGVEERSFLANLSAYGATVGARERETIELENRQKEFLAMQQSPVLNGQLRASLGNYFTPRVHIWLGTLTPEYDYQGEASYHRTKGYAANTDRSGGSASVKGGITFMAGALQGGRLGGDAAWSTENYRFFGSTTPTARRTHTNALFGASITSSSTSRVYWNATLGYRYDTVDDNGIGTQQHRASAQGVVDVPLDPVALRGFLGYRNASLSGTLTESLSLFDVGLGTSRYWLNKFFVQGSARLFVAKGMLNQGFTRIYPDVSVGYLLENMHLISLTYTGALEFLDLPTALAWHPYLAAGTVYRHSDRARQAMAAVESDWSPSLRTKLTAAYEEVYDYPLYSDPLKVGIGQLTYGGKTRILSFRAEGFAKFTPNDYVGTKLLVRSTKNSVTQLAVPYLPVVEVVGTYTHAFPFGLNTSLQATYRGPQETDLVTSQKLAGYFVVDLVADYELFSSLRLFLNLHNITNKRYELWRGYQAPPFLISAGASYRW
ncbi:MAG TPA: hypothetical protein VNL36_00695 [Bacteroidota bacterium]|nr:hypothetical protein [Bacteroidota bacterium]